jgi:hypothetical protein
MNYGGDRMKKTFETEIDTPVGRVKAQLIIDKETGNGLST